MKTRSSAARAVLVLVVILWLASFAVAAEVKEVTVMVSSGFMAALQQLGPEFERSTGTKVVAGPGPSMGDTPQAIPNRLKRGEPADVVIMVGYALEGLVQQGKVLPDSRVDLARAGIAMAVRAGAPTPDISTVEAFKGTLLAAKSIAYSDSASGVYLTTDLFPRLGIADQIMSKSRKIPAEPVGKVVARGEAEIGFQQMSELLPIEGITVVGPLPPPLQTYTVFTAGVVTDSKNPEGAKALIRFLASPSAGPVIIKTGLEPAGSSGKK